VRGHAANYDIDPALLAAVIEQESKFRADAKSSAGAIGLMQLLPDTAKGIAIHTGGSKFVLSDLYNPEINIRYGAWYLHHLMQRYGDEKTALAAYNAGQQNVDRWRAEGKGIEFPETRAYVDKVERLKGIYRRAYAKELGLKGQAGPPAARSGAGPSRVAPVATPGRPRSARSAPRSAAS
jgi:soluble lytic murein transglycosylase